MLIFNRAFEGIQSWGKLPKSPELPKMPKLKTSLPAD
jgi:hypothetical protein